MPRARRRPRRLAHGAQPHGWQREADAGGLRGRFRARPRTAGTRSPPLGPLFTSTRRFREVVLRLARWPTSRLAGWPTSSPGASAALLSGRVATWRRAVANWASRLCPVPLAPLRRDLCISAELCRSVLNYESDSPSSSHGTQRKRTH